MSPTTARANLAYLLPICLVATLGGLLFGYDTAVIAGAIGFLQEHFALTSAMKGWAASSALAVWVLAFVLGYSACFALSVGPVTWVILSEIFPTRVRGRALGVATFGLWTANFIVSQTFPMMDDNAWLVAKFNHAFPFYVYAAFCVVLVIVVWRLVPETKGRTLEEIERQWSHR